MSLYRTAISLYAFGIRIFCSGIGGIGLSAYASHMRLLCHDVWGSDRTDSALLDDLRRQGVRISLLQDGSAIPDGTDLFAYSEAIPEDAPERIEAKRRSIRQISYFQALGELTADKRLIAVCGTHGKSSTTAMAALVLMQADFDPNVVVGTKVPQMNGRNWRKGASDLWLVEACEYRRSFLFLQPAIILLTNADGDHFDAFAGQSDYQKAFVEFVSSLPENGVVIAHGKDEVSMNIVRAAKRTFIDADTEALPLLSIPGVHMQRNAQLVIALAKHLKISPVKTQESLRSYSGSWRRMEVKGTKNGITVVDDYAHHPVEISATLAAMKAAYPEKRIVAVFQPHTHDRTLRLWDEFATCFTNADIVLLTSVYDARPDREKGRVDETAFAKAIEMGSKKTTSSLGSLKNTEQILCSKMLRSGDVVVVMGAGDSTKLAESLLTSCFPVSSIPDH